MIWTGYIRAFPSMLVTLLLVFLPIMASGEAQPPEVAVGEQEQEPAVTKGTAEGWKAMQACFECHDMSEKSISQQPRQQQKKHREVMAKQRSCVDCHNETNIHCCHDNLFPKIN